MSVTLEPGLAPGLVEEIMAAIEERLGDPGLNPRTIAEQHHVSVRYLHLLFHRRGTTVNGWIRARRLEAARRDLAPTGARRRSVAAVAGCWGFPSASHFSRVFRATYGMSPTQWRDQGGQVGHIGHSDQADRP